MFDKGGMGEDDIHQTMIHFHPIQTNGRMCMEPPKQPPYFWLGNGLLALALLLLLFMDPLSQMLGVGAVALWMIVAAAGMYFIMKN